MAAAIFAHVGIILEGFAIWGIVLGAANFARGHAPWEVALYVAGGVAVFVLSPIVVLIASRHRGTPWRRSILLAAMAFGIAVSASAAAYPLLFR